MGNPLYLQLHRRFQTVQPSVPRLCEHCYVAGLAGNRLTIPLCFLLFVQVMARFATVQADRSNLSASSTAVTAATHPWARKREPGASQMVPSPKRARFEPPDIYSLPG